MEVEKSEKLIVVNGRYFFWIYQNKLSDESEKIHTHEWDDNDDGAPHFPTSSAWMHQRVD